MVEILVSWVERVIDLERTAAFGERAENVHVSACNHHLLSAVDAEVYGATGLGVNVGVAVITPGQRVVVTVRHTALPELEGDKSEVTSRVSNDHFRLRAR